MIYEQNNSTPPVVNTVASEQAPPPVDLPKILLALWNAQPRAVRVFSPALEVIWDNAPELRSGRFAPYRNGLGHVVSVPPDGPEREEWPVRRAQVTGARAERYYEVPGAQPGDAQVYRVQAWPLTLAPDSEPCLVEEIEQIDDTARQQHLECERKLRQLDEQVSMMLNSVIDFLSAESEGDLLRLRLTNPHLQPCHDVKDCQRRQCPAYEEEARRCWDISGTLCPEGPDTQHLIEKFHYCSQCEVFLLACPDPLTRVGENFNRLLTLLQLKYYEALEAHRRLQQTEKVATLGEMMLGIAHEIKNPLGIIVGRLDCLALEFDTITRQELMEDIEVVHQQAARVKTIIDQLLAMARPSPPHLENVSVAEIIQNVIPMVRKTLEQRRVSLSIQVPNDLPDIRADAVEIQQVLLNLILNARDAMPRGGHIRIQTRLAKPSPKRKADTSRAGNPQNDNPDGGAELIVSVADNGHGIPPDYQERIFSPFFSTKTGGTGLGLAVCRRIMRRHNGRITVHSAPGRGATFHLHFPLGDQFSVGKTTAS
ncbi:MAG: hypothetical protein Kow0059_21490 [Candidatus Sumerlaeia bacterium]